MQTGRYRYCLNIYNLYGFPDSVVFCRVSKDYIPIFEIIGFDDNIVIYIWDMNKICIYK